MLKGYFCSHCNINFICTEEKSNCPFCNGSIEEKVFSFDYSNTHFGHFQKSMEDARREYKRKLRDPFLPFSFRNRNIVKKIVKCYVPFYCCNTHLDGVVDFICKDKKSDLKYHTQMRCNLDFKNEFISLNSILPSNCVNTISNTFSYDFFQDGFLENGTVLLDVNANIDDENEKYHKELLNVLLYSTKKKIPHDLKSIKNHSIQIQDLRQNIVFLPIYFVMIPYQNKQYYFVMCGENGEVYFSKTQSKASIIAFSIILFFILFTSLIIILLLL